MDRQNASFVKQWHMLDIARRECYARMSIEPPKFSNGLWCNRTWDGVMCWDDSPASTVVKQRCPSYINGLNNNNFAYKKCTSSGTWYQKTETNTTWTNYSSCINRFPKESFGDISQIQDHMNRIAVIINVGYGASFITLSAAIMILILCRRFNYKSTIIHINLFLAFLIRSFFALLRQNLFTHGYAMSIDMEEKNGKLLFKPGIHWECRLLFTVFVYGVAVSQTWIFVEGLYLQMLFYRTLLTQQRGIKAYVIFGWCFPLTFLIPWVIVRSKYDNVLCWSIEKKVEYAWINRAPLILIIVINFVFFIDNICILFKRTQARMKNRTARKLAKFIVMLVPLFGVPNILFMFNPPDLNAVIDLPYLYISLIYSSFQGVILSFLYCFLHGEVRLTMQQSFNRFLSRQRTNQHLPSHEHRCVANLRRGSFGSSPHTPLTNVSEVNGSCDIIELHAITPEIVPSRHKPSTPNSFLKKFRYPRRKNQIQETQTLRIAQLPHTRLDRGFSQESSSGKHHVTAESGQNEKADSAN